MAPSMGKGLSTRLTNLRNRITPLFTEPSTVGTDRILRDKMFHHIVGTKTMPKFKNMTQVNLMNSIFDW